MMSSYYTRSLTKHFKNKFLPSRATAPHLEWQTVSNSLENGPEMQYCAMKSAQLNVGSSSEDQFPSQCHREVLARSETSERINPIFLHKVSVNLKDLNSPIWHLSSPSEFIRNLTEVCLLLNREKNAMYIIIIIISLYVQNRTQKLLLNEEIFCEWGKRSP